MASSKKSFYNFFYIAAAIFLLAYVFISVQQMHEWGGWLLMLFFLSLCFAFR